MYLIEINVDDITAYLRLSPTCLFSNIDDFLGPCESSIYEIVPDVESCEIDRASVFFGLEKASAFLGLIQRVFRIKYKKGNRPRLYLTRITLPIANLLTDNIAF